MSYRLLDGPDFVGVLGPIALVVEKITELITLRGPWRTVDDVELATLGWVDWWNHRRLLWPVGGVSPAEFEPPGSRSSKTSPPEPPGGPMSTSVV